MGFSWFLSFLLLAKFLIAMASILSFRKFCYVEPVKCSSFNFGSFETLKADNNEQFEAPKVEKKVEKDVDVDSVTEILLDKQNKKKRPNKRGNKEWRCVDCCCWIIGYTCTTWWLLLFLYHSLPANLPGLRVAEPPRTRLKREGLIAHHQLFLCPALSPAALSFGKGSLAQKGFSGSGFGVVASVKSSRGLSSIIDLI